MKEIIIKKGLTDDTDDLAKLKEENKRLKDELEKKRLREENAELRTKLASTLRSADKWFYELGSGEKIPGYDE